MLKIEIGKTYGKLTVLGRAKNTDWGLRQWLCKCELCGNKKVVSGPNIFRFKSCGCLRFGCRKIKPGQKFGKLTAVRFLRRGGAAKAPYFLFKCECGNEKELNAYRVLHGLTKNCGCFRRQQVSIRTRLTRLSGIEGGARVLFHQYKARAKIKNQPFELTLDDFKKLAIQPCRYCGKIRSRNLNCRHRNVLINGIDRIDSRFGYLVQNAASSCKICNVAKSNLTSEEFKVWLAEAAQHSLLNEVYQNGLGI